VVFIGLTSDYVDLDIMPFWGDIQMAPRAADESFGFIMSMLTALRFGCKAIIWRRFLRLRPFMSSLSNPCNSATSFSLTPRLQPGETAPDTRRQPF
jgi:hypothetical protein